MNLRNDVYVRTNGKTILKINGGKSILSDRILNQDLIINEDLVNAIKYCDGERTPKEILNILSREYDLSEDILSKKLNDVFLDLRTQGFLEFSNSKMLVPIKLVKNKYDYSLNDVYLEVTKRCNFSCIHCYANCPSLNKEKKWILK